VSRGALTTVNREAIGYTSRLTHTQRIRDSFKLATRGVTGNPIVLTKGDAASVGMRAETPKVSRGLCMGYRFGASCCSGWRAGSAGFAYQTLTVFDVPVHQCCRSVGRTRSLLYI